MWHELADGTMQERKICPIMSEPTGIVLCQGSNCAAANCRRLDGETIWFCELIEGHALRAGGNP